MEYTTKSIKELKQEGYKRKIKYASKMNKNELVTVLTKNDLDPTYTVDPDIVKICKERFQVYIDKYQEKIKVYQREYRRKQKERQAKRTHH